MTVSNDYYLCPFKVQYTEIDKAKWIRQSVFQIYCGIILITMY